jgi:hypothetical protein
VLSNLDAMKAKEVLGFGEFVAMEKMFEDALDDSLRGSGRRWLEIMLQFSVVIFSNNRIMSKYERRAKVDLSTNESICWFSRLDLNAIFLFIVLSAHSLYTRDCFIHLSLPVPTLSCSLSSVSTPTMFSKGPTLTRTGTCSSGAV